MFGIRFAKIQPTTYVLQYKTGKVKREGAGLSFFYYSPTTKLVSQMPENGVIFSDGIEADFIEFNSGMEATISVADKKGHLVS